MLDLLRSTLRDDAGATAIEYGLIGSLIAMVIVAATTLLGVSLQQLFSSIAAAL